MKFCWVTINVRNMKDSLRFYSDIIGLEVLRTLTHMPGTEIAFLGEGNSREYDKDKGDGSNKEAGKEKNREVGANNVGTWIELIHNDRSPDPQHAQDISLGFEVDSVDDHIAVLKEKGITHITGPFQPDPMIKFIYVEDPDGVKIQFVEHAGQGCCQTTAPLEPEGGYTKTGTVKKPGLQRRI